MRILPADPREYGLKMGIEVDVEYSDGQGAKYLEGG
jgi:hypothetical protein